MKDERRRDLIHMGPSFLPDGRHFLFWAGPADPGVYVASLDDNEVKLVLRTDSAAIYSPAGYLLFMRKSTLMAQPFDAARMSTTGDPMPVAEEVDRFISLGAFSVSGDGVLVFRPLGADQTALVWVDRIGRRSLSWRHLARTAMLRFRQTKIMSRSIGIAARVTRKCG